MMGNTNILTVFCKTPFFAFQPHFLFTPPFCVLASKSSSLFHSKKLYGMLCIFRILLVFIPRRNVANAKKSHISIMKLSQEKAPGSPRPGGTLNPYADTPSWGTLGATSVPLDWSTTTTSVPPLPLLRRTSTVNSNAKVHLCNKQCTNTLNIS